LSTDNSGTEGGRWWWWSPFRQPAENALAVVVRPAQRHLALCGLGTQPQPRLAPHIRCTVPRATQQLATVSPEESQVPSYPANNQLGDWGGRTQRQKAQSVAPSAERVGASVHAASQPASQPASTKGAPQRRSVRQRAGRSSAPAAAAVAAAEAWAAGADGGSASGTTVVVAGGCSPWPAPSGGAPPPVPPVADSSRPAWSARRKLTSTAKGSNTPIASTVAPAVARWLLSHSVPGWSRSTHSPSSSSTHHSSESPSSSRCGKMHHRAISTQAAATSHARCRCSARRSRCGAHGRPRHRVSHNARNGHP
jgi:hypothetical protein